MKKLLSSILCLTMVMSLAACSGKQPEQTVSESTETTAEVTAEVSETTTAAETTEMTTSETNETTAEATTASETSETTAAAKVLNKKAYLKDKVIKFKNRQYYNEKKKKWIYETIEYHFPELLIKSTYADAINKAMAKKIKAYQKEYKKSKTTGDLGTEYIAYLTKEGILSLVFIVTTENDQIDCRVYNIDVITGEKVSNARIAQIAGVSDIRKAAMNALQAKYNKEKYYKVKNYKVVKKKGQKKNQEDKDVEKTFNKKHLNANMKIGLTDKGILFFISEYETGAGDNEGIYDANGKDLYTEKNPNWVRPK